MRPLLARLAHTLAAALARPRHICPVCHCRTHNIDGHLYIDHQGDPEP